MSGIVYGEVKELSKPVQESCTIPPGTIQVEVRVGTVDMPHRFRANKTYFYDEMRLKEVLDLYEEYRKKLFVIATEAEIGEEVK